MVMSLPSQTPPGLGKGASVPPRGEKGLEQQWGVWGTTGLQRLFREVRNVAGKGRHMALPRPVPPSSNFQLVHCKNF